MRSEGKPRLGQKVHALDRLRRTFVEGGREIHWLRYGDTAALKPKPVTGAYVGSRTKQNGHVNYWGDEGAIWSRSGSVEVWLVSFADRQLPACVLPEDCTFTKEQDHE